MALNLSISQRLTQSQVLAPQLQHSLALLQAPTLELKAMVEEELQQNPLLEEVQAEDQEQSERPNSDADTQIISKAQEADPTEPPADVTFDPATEKPSNDPVDDFQAEFERLTQLDQEWRDHFAETNIPMRASQEDEEKRQFMFDSMTVGTSLQEHLMEQVRLSELTDEQRPLAETLVGMVGHAAWAIFCKNGTDAGEICRGSEDHSELPSGGGGRAGFARVPVVADGTARETKHARIQDRA